MAKGFNFVERSPLSRASLLGAGVANMSVISNYYNNGGQQTVTPLRTCGVNSPVIFNFQSPSRRKSAFVYQMKMQNIANNGGIKEENVEKKVQVQTFEEALGKICLSG